MVDKDLFLYDLAVVAIMKCEGPYLKEWLDYHLAAGVEHFYIYDNESPDNQAEVAKPYVDAGLVDYFPWPGQLVQALAYKDAVNRFKFQCRYMAFIDGDEFIYPKSNRAIVEVVDEILSHDPNAGGLAINWQIFGSNGQEKADYSRPVLERFTCRAEKDFNPPNRLVKSISNPRAIDDAKVAKTQGIHTQAYFKGLHVIREDGNIISGSYLKLPVVCDKIVVNHYHTKSKEEYLNKIERGRATTTTNRTMAEFIHHDRNDEFDDGIIKYRDARTKVYQPPKPRSADDLIKALKRNLLTDSYAGKMETFLTCRAVSNHLGENFFEEMALYAIVKALETSLSAADKELFDKELPEFLKLPYPAVEDLRFALKPAECNCFQDALSNYPIEQFINQDLLNF